MAFLAAAGVVLAPAGWWQYTWIVLIWLVRHWPAIVLIAVGSAGWLLASAWRRPVRRTGTGPAGVRLPLPVHVATLLALGAAVAAVAGLGLWWLLGRTATGGSWSTQNTFDAVKIALSVVAGVGAVVALTVAYRKQVIAESAENEDHGLPPREPVGAQP